MGKHEGEPGRKSLVTLVTEKRLIRTEIRLLTGTEKVTLNLNTTQGQVCSLIQMNLSLNIVHMCRQRQRLCQRFNVTCEHKNWSVLNPLLNVNGNIDVNDNFWQGFRISGVFFMNSGQRPCFNNTFLWWIPNDRSYCNFDVATPTSFTCQCFYKL